MGLAFSRPLISRSEGIQIGGSEIFSGCFGCNGHLCESSNGCVSCSLLSPFPSKSVIVCSADSSSIQLLSIVPLQFSPSLLLLHRLTFILPLAFASFSFSHSPNVFCLFSQDENQLRDAIPLPSSLRGSLPLSEGRLVVWLLRWSCWEDAVSHSTELSSRESPFIE